MQQDPIVTVVMPNFNDAAYLGGAIAAIRAQIEGIGRLIFIDDGSDDDSVETARRAVAGWAAAEVRVNPVNRGVIPTINEALADVATPYVYFAASNDQVLPGFFTHSLELLRHHPHAGLCSARIRFLDEKNREGTLMRSACPLASPGYLAPSDALNALERLGNWIVGTATIYRTGALRQQGGFDPRLHGATDSVAAMTLAVRHGACFLPDPGAYWRQSSDGYARASILDWNTVAETVANGHARLSEACGPGSRYPDMWRREQYFWHFCAALGTGNPDAAARHIASALGLSPISQALLRLPLPRAMLRVLAMALIVPRKFLSAINRAIV